MDPGSADRDRDRPAEASLHGGTLALAHARLGEFALALEWVDRASDVGKRSGNPTAIVDADLARAMIEALRGSSAEATKYAAIAADYADQVDNKACGMVARSVIGDQHLLLDQPAIAIPILQEAADLAVYCRMVPVRVEMSRALLGSARARSGVEAWSFDGLDGALELARSTGDRLGEGEILRQRARDRFVAGGPLEAVLEDYASSEAVFAAIESPPDLARTLIEHGTLLVEQGRDDGTELLARGRALLEAMGLGPTAEVAGSAS